MLQSIPIFIEQSFINTSLRYATVNLEKATTLGYDDDYYSSSTMKRLQHMALFCGNIGTFMFFVYNQYTVNITRATYVFMTALMQEAFFIFQHYCQDKEITENKYILSDITPKILSFAALIAYEYIFNKSPIYIMPKLPLTVMIGGIMLSSLFSSIVRDGNKSNALISWCKAFSNLTIMSVTNDIYDYQHNAMYCMLFAIYSGVSNVFPVSDFADEGRGDDNGEDIEEHDEINYSLQPDKEAEHEPTQYGGMYDNFIRLLCQVVGVVYSYKIGNANHTLMLAALYYATANEKVCYNINNSILSVVGELICALPIVQQTKDLIKAR